MAIYSGSNGRGETVADTTTLQLDGNAVGLYGGGNGRGETVFQVTTSPIPIKLTAFDAYLIGKEIRVQWQTAQEINSAFFIVEKSLDGINWQSIGMVNASGNSATTKNYQLTDLHPADGINYYRLRSVDIDGRFTYSAVAAVHYHEASLEQVTVYPNPVQYQFTIKVSGSSSAKMDVKLMNVSGQVVLAKQNLIGSTQTIDISNLSAGNYFLTVNYDGIISTAKIVKE